MVVSTANAVPAILRREHSFERFIKGDGNALACSACQAVAEFPGEAYNPLFIYGKVGLGKTHLLHAIGNDVLRRWKDTRVIYVTSEKFAIDLVASIRDRKTEQFRNHYRKADVLLIDDIHFLREKEGTQEELFHTFNELHELGRQVVLSSDRLPEELSSMQDRLVSRFRWGMVADIQPPNYETRLAILKAKAQENRCDVPDELLSIIAKRVHSSVRALEGALIRVLAYADLQDRALDESLVEGVIPAELLAEDAITISMIKTKVADRYGVTVAEIDSESREKRIAEPRHIAVYLARELTHSSFPTLAASFGGRDHSTMMYAYRKVCEMQRAMPLIQGEIDGIKRELQVLRAV
ncbi:chromosomal replication initiator protein DnaA [Candidatus Acetothermia bacterium]|nr:chromosomal replication initiator protein DnaA [Candidatus Acetothermia bacterium]